MRMHKLKLHRMYTSILKDNISVALLGCKEDKNRELYVRDRKTDNRVPVNSHSEVGNNSRLRLTIVRFLLPSLLIACVIYVRLVYCQLICNHHYTTLLHILYIIL